MTTKNSQEIKEVVLSLRELRKTEGYSIQQLHDMVHEKRPHDAPSLSTFKSVFSDKIEDKTFNYDMSIRPIAAVLLGLEDEDKEYDAKHSETYFARQEAFKALIDAKNARIERLEEMLETVQKEKDFLKAQFEDLKKTRDKLFDMLSKQ